MKIGIVCYPTFGGSGVVATELGLELSKRGHEVHFITYKQPVRLELLSHNVHFHEVHVPRGLKAGTHCVGFYPRAGGPNFGESHTAILT